MLKRLAAVLVVVALIGAGAGWLLTSPNPVSADALPDHQPDPENGALVFHAAGCASCHAAPKSEGEQLLVLSGGLELATPFGVFRVPNISTDRADGIGAWTPLEFVNAVMHGISPEGAHYYPAFPYTSYARMSTEDVLDLKAFMDSLPAVKGKVASHSLPFPFNIRRGLGLWKIRYLSPAPVLSPQDRTAMVKRGQYLVEGPGHCGECHTPRDFMGGLDRGKWLAGAPSPEGRGTVPNITAHADGLGEWSMDDITFYLESGLTPSFDVVGGAMAPVQREMAKLPASDREAIAAYLKAVPAVPNGYTPVSPQ